MLQFSVRSNSEKVFRHIVCGGHPCDEAERRAVPSHPCDFKLFAVGSAKTGDTITLVPHRELKRDVRALFRCDPRSEERLIDGASRSLGGQDASNYPANADPTRNSPSG